MNPRPLRLAAFALLAAAAAPVAAQTAFTYQGQLNEDSLPADGDYDFVFRLYDAPSGGNEVAPAAGIDDWPVSGGQFMVQIDFGSAAFDGDPRWIRVEVRPGDSVGPYTVLDPRQPVTPAPYALYAFGGAGGGGGFWTASGSHIYNANAGNVGIGTTAPLDELHVAGQAATLRLEDTANPGGYTLVEDAQSTQLRISKANAGGDVVLDLDPKPLDGAGSALVRFFRSTNTTGVKGLRLHRGNSTTQISTLLGVDGADSWFQAHGGNFGIGTTTPLASFQVDGRLGEQTIRFSGSDGNYRFLQQLNSSDHAAWTFRPGTGAPALRITYDGNVGVGTSSPVARLNAVADTDDAIRGSSIDGAGLIGNSGTGTGVFGSSATGKAGHFLIANTANGDNAVEGHTYGTGVAVHGHTEGDGWAGYFVNRSATNAKTALYCRTDGTGLAFHAEGTARVDVLEITGADVAEKFPTSESGAIEPGTVMAIDPASPGKLCIAAGAYNRRVAGVVSGAGDLPVGAVLGNLKGQHPDAPPIALSGRVWVRCDASERAILPGDMLTTADRAGHAMAVADHARAHGAVIGKAMTALEQGESGLVLVLVNLQ